MDRICVIYQNAQTSTGGMKLILKGPTIYMSFLQKHFPRTELTGYGNFPSLAAGLYKVITLKKERN